MELMVERPSSLAQPGDLDGAVHISTAHPAVHSQSAEDRHVRYGPSIQPCDPEAVANLQQCLKTISCSVDQCGDRLVMLVLRMWVDRGPAEETGSQCTARSKATGERCLRHVRGGGVCYSRGGNAPKVKAAREARIVGVTAELEAAKKGQPYERRHPGEVLLDAVMTSDILMRHLLEKRAAGELTAEEATALGWAIDRASRTAKTACRHCRAAAGYPRAPDQAVGRPVRAGVAWRSADPRVTVEPGTQSQIILAALRG